MTPDANDLCVFAIKRGAIKNRLDYVFYAAEAALMLKTKHRKVKLGNVVRFIYRYPSFYGIKYVPHGIGILKGENIDREGNWIGLEDIDYIDTETNERFNKTIRYSNDSSR